MAKTKPSSKKPSKAQTSEGEGEVEQAQQATTSHTERQPAKKKAAAKRPPTPEDEDSSEDEEVSEEVLRPAASKDAAKKGTTSPQQSDESEVDSEPLASSTQTATAQRPRRTMAQKAGLVFPPLQIQRDLKTMFPALKFTKDAAVYMAAAVEYVAAEVLELSGDAAKDNKKARITPHHIQLAVRQDHELNDLLKNVTIPSGGVVPNIHIELLKTKKQKEAAKKRKLTEQQEEEEADDEAPGPSNRNAPGPSKRYKGNPQPKASVAQSAGYASDDSD